MRFWVCTINMDDWPIHNAVPTQISSSSRRGNTHSSSNIWCLKMVWWRPLESLENSHQSIFKYLVGHNIHQFISSSNEASLRMHLHLIRRMISEFDSGIKASGSICLHETKKLPHYPELNKLQRGSEANYQKQPHARLRGNSRLQHLGWFHPTTSREVPSSNTARACIKSKWN